MEMRIDLNYRDIIKLIKQLPDEQFDRLSEYIRSKGKKKSSSNENQLKELLMSSPTWSDEDYNYYLEKKEHLKRFREL